VAIKRADRDGGGETPPYPLSHKGYPVADKVADKQPDGDPALSAAIRRFLRDNPAVVAEALERYRADRDRAAEAARDAAVEPFLKAAARDRPGPGLGNADAPATVYAFVDYRCGHCKREDKVLRALAAETPGVRVAFVEYPILGGTSVYAARAALAAAEQGKYQPLHRALMDHRGALTAAAVDALASALDIDIAAMKTAMNGAAIADRIARNKAAAARLGFFGTPSFVIGGRRRSGFLDAATIRALLAAGRRDAATAATADTPYPLSLKGYPAPGKKADRDGGGETPDTPYPLSHKGYPVTDNCDPKTPDTRPCAAQGRTP